MRMSAKLFLLSSVSTNNTFPWLRDVVGGFQPCSIATLVLLGNINLCLV
jgi:hypothetical protein